jgi:hypothetical protein
MHRRRQSCHERDHAINWHISFQPLEEQSAEEHLIEDRHVKTSSDDSIIPC